MGKELYKVLEENKGEITIAIKDLLKTNQPFATVNLVAKTQKLLAQCNIEYDTNIPDGIKDVYDNFLKKYCDEFGIVFKTTRYPKYDNGEAIIHNFWFARTDEE